MDHRPRRFGTSHHGVRNRVCPAFVDMLGVRWPCSRRLRCDVVEDTREVASAARAVLS